MPAMANRASQWVRKNRRSVSKRSQTLLPAAALFCVAALYVAGFGWTGWVQQKAFDVFQNLQPREWTDAGVRVIDIDDESLARLGQWPWPRTQVARLTTRLRDMGAAAVVFDAFFSEPDRTSPARIASSWPDEPEFRAAHEHLKSLPDHDRILARTMAGGRVVLGFALTNDVNNVVPEAKASFAFAGDGPLSYLHNYTGAVANLPVLEKAAAGLGNIGFQAESDQVVRRVPLLFRRGKTLLPALSMEALRVAQGVSNYAVKASGASGESAGGQHTGITAVKVGQFVVPTDGEGRVWVYYTRDSASRTIPAWKLFEKGFDPASVEGTISYVGTSASGLKDLRITPLNPSAPGVEAHANLTEQILTGTFLQRPDWAPGAELLYLIVLGLILLAILTRAGARWSAPAVTIAIGATIGLSWHAFTAWRWLLDPVFPTLALAAVYVTWSAISFVKSEVEKRNVTEAFGKSLHPKLVADLAKHPERLVLGGETREITILFCDIRGFTTISEQYDAQGLTGVINRFLTPMSRIIMERFGYIDKYIGDCIMAFWNAPSDDADHARNACRTILEMRMSLKALNETWREEAEAEGRKHLPVNIGMGLNTGPCCVGYMGSDQKLNYTTLGDDVNLS